MFPFLALVAVAAVLMAHAERAAPLLHSGAVARDVQRRDDRVRRDLRAAGARLGRRADRRRSPPARSPAVSDRSLLQWPAIRREGFRYRPRAGSARSVAAARSAASWCRASLGLAAVQINLFVNSWLAASLGTGAVSWLDYAFRLMYMPIGLFGISIATASLPTISGHAATSDDAGVRRAVSSGLRMMLMLNIPATVGPDRARHTDRGADFRARPVHAGRHGGNGGRAGLLRARADRIFRRETDLPAFYAMGNSRIPVIASAASVGAQHRLEPAVGPVARPSWARARHGHCGSAECRSFSSGCCAHASAASKAAACSNAVMKISIASSPWHSRRTMPNGSCTSHLAGAASWRRLFAFSAPSRSAMVVLALSSHVLRIEEFAELRRRRFALLNVVDSTPMRRYPSRGPLTRHSRSGPARFLPPSRS